VLNISNKCNKELTTQIPCNAIQRFYDLTNKHNTTFRLVKRGSVMKDSAHSGL